MKIIYYVSYPKLQGLCASCDPYFRVVMGTR